MYKLPDSLPEDITRLGILAKEYQQKKIEATQFKAYRVPMGIYEQRKDEVYMARVRTTGGVIYPSQFLQLIELAKKYKSNLLHITTRQEIQVQNLDLAEVEPLLHEISTLGLATKGGGGNTVRNIMVSQYSGIGKEVFDATPYAIQLTSKLIAEIDSYLLPRKMKIAFSSDDQHIDFAAINDVGFVSKIKNGQQGFMVYAGGGAGAKPTVGEILFDFIPVEELFYVAEALKKFFSDHGNRKNKHKARLRFVYYKLGKEETHRLIYEYYEQEKKTGELQKNDWVGSPENERPPFSYSEISVDDKDKASFEEWKKRYVINQVQGGYSSILVPVILGDIYINDTRTVESYQKLLQFINQFGKDTLRFTTEQNIRLRNIPNIALSELFYILGELILDRDAPVLTNNIVSCTGADTCRLGIGFSKGLASAIREELKKSSYDLDKLSDTQIHISGCPNSCGQQLWGDIGFSGKVMRNSRTYPGYQIFLASRRDLNPKLAESVGSVNAKSIPLFVRRLLEGYIDVEEKYDSLSHYLNTKGNEIAKKLIEEYKEIPSFAEEQSYYYDWGADTIFNITNRGIAECSAGLFDMIDLDLNFINTNKEGLKSENNTAKRNQLLYDILFSTSRMLLVTRGADPKTTDDVFNLFIKSFIDFGFIEDKYKEIVILARDEKKYDFDSRINEIYALTDRVIDLYKTMDDSLQFKVK